MSEVQVGRLLLGTTGNWTRGWLPGAKPGNLVTTPPQDGVAVAGFGASTRICGGRLGPGSRERRRLLATRNVQTLNVLNY